MINENSIPTTMYNRILGVMKKPSPIRFDVKIEVNL